MKHIDVRLVWLIVAMIVLSILATTPYHLVLPYLWWRYIHIVSAALYSGVIVISTLFEWRIYQSGQVSLMSAYSQLVTSVDKRLITASVSSLLFSAIALQSYRALPLWRMDLWPLWSSASLILLSLTGALWTIFDVKTQQQLNDTFTNESAEQARSDHMQTIIRLRHRINLFSVVTIPILYYLMVFKPQ